MIFPLLVKKRVGVFVFGVGAVNDAFINRVQGDANTTSKG